MIKRKLSSTKQFLRCVSVMIGIIDRSTAVKIIIIFGFFLVASWWTVDPDFGWHLRSGQYYLTHGIPSRDIFTYTAAWFPWVNHEWGSDVLLAIIYGVGGYDLLLIFYAALWTAALFIHNHKISLGVMLLAATALIPYIGVREFAWTLLGFVIAYRLLKSSSKYAVYLLLPLTAIWANLHGGFVIVFALIGYYTLSKRSWRLAAMLGGSMLVSLLNPYGITLYEEIIRTLFDPVLHKNIQEWQPLSFEPSVLLFIAVWITAYLLLYGRQWKSLLNLNPLLLISSISATRNAPFFIIHAMNDIEMMYRKLMNSLQTTEPHLRRRATLLLSSSCAVFIVIGLYFTYTPSFVRGDWYPQQTLTYLRDTPCKGNLFTLYNYAGYVRWKLPGTQSYIDGRMPSWRDETGTLYLDRYAAILNNPEDRRREFTQYDVSCVLTSIVDNENFAQHLKEDGWKVMVKDNNSQVLISPEEHADKVLRK